MKSANPLRILMLAPEPFFQPRGTPFSEYHRIRALLDLGHAVDLVTYALGEDVRLPGLTIFRSPRLPFVRDVKIGPSLLKAVLDVQLAFTALRRSRRASYDIVHSHEEAGIVGLWLARRLGVPHIYDMHSSLPQQLSNFRYSRSRTITSLFERLERRMVSGSQAIITVCKELEDKAAALGARDRAFLIENVCGGDMEAVAGPGPDSLRARWNIPAGSQVVLYTGTFEPYQGLDMLVEAAAIVAKVVPTARFLVAGGTTSQVESAQHLAAGAGAPMIFTGQLPPHEIPHLIDLCDVLVSPRISGTNTPLKIYSYLRSGKPIVATDLLTHTQVLDATTARLAEPKPAAFAEAIIDLLTNPEKGRRLAESAARLAAERYDRRAYVAKVEEAYARAMAAAKGEAIA